MGSFRRVFLGYRRADVDAAIASRDGRLGELDMQLNYLSVMVVERDRQIGDLHEQVRAANDRLEHGLKSLESVALRVDEIEAQARGQATRIRMKALAEAAEMSKRAQQLAERLDPENAAPTEQAAPAAQTEEVPAASNGHGEIEPAELFEGQVKVEVGPLGDFSQLLGFEQAAETIAATSEISVENFSEGRATLSIHLDEPVELLRELEERSPFEFKIRQTGGDRVVLDVDDGDAADAEAA